MAFPIEKDEDGEEFSNSIRVNPVSNGWILTVTDTEDMEYTEVFEFSNADGLLESIRAALKV